MGGKRSCACEDGQRGKIQAAKGSTKGLVEPVHSLRCTKRNCSTSSGPLRLAPQVSQSPCSNDQLYGSNKHVYYVSFHPVQGCSWAGAYPSCHRTRGGGHTLDRCQSAKKKEAITPTTSLESPINLTFKHVFGGRGPSWPVDSNPGPSVLITAQCYSLLLIFHICDIFKREYLPY